MDLPRPRRALALAVAMAALALGLVATAAGAHPWLDQSSVPADANQPLRLTVPVESDDTTVGNEEIDVHVPVAFTGLGCLPSLGWTCEVDETDPVDIVVRWVRVGGVARPEAFDFVVRTPATEGSYAFVVDQRRSDLSIIHWGDAPTGPHPAPRLRVTAAGSQPEANLSPPTSHAPTTTNFDMGPPATAPTAPGQPTVPGGKAGGTGGGGTGGGRHGGGTGSGSTATVPGATSTTDRPGSRSTATTDIPEVGEEDAIPPGGMSLGLPDDDHGDATKLTPARIAVGLAATFGALMTWLLLRRAKAPLES